MTKERILPVKIKDNETLSQAKKREARKKEIDDEEFEMRISKD